MVIRMLVFKPEESVWNYFPKILESTGFLKTIRIDYVRTQNNLLLLNHNEQTKLYPEIFIYICFTNPSGFIKPLLDLICFFENLKDQYELVP